MKEPIAHKTTAAAPVAHTRYLSSSPATTSHGKTQGFVLRLPHQNIAHATFMQPFQCDLQPQLQETHRTTHTGTTTCCKTHRRNMKEPIAHKTTAAAPIAHTRYLSSSPATTLHGKTQGFVLRLPRQNIAHATFMQPFQCDLQPQLQETHRTMHPGTTTCCKTHRRNMKEPIAHKTTAAAPVAHTRYLSSSPATTLHGKTQGFVLRLPPENIAHATSCSHSNAICNHSFRKRIELRTQEQPLVAKHIEGTNRAQNDRSCTRRTHEVPFIVACNHFTRKNTRFRAPASSPKHSPCNIHAAIPMRSATTASGNA